MRIQSVLFGDEDRDDFVNPKISMAQEEITLTFKDDNGVGYKAVAQKVRDQYYEGILVPKTLPPHAPKDLLQQKTIIKFNVYDDAGERQVVLAEWDLEGGGEKQVCMIVK